MKNLLDKIEDINKDIERINESIDNLLSEQINPLEWLLRRKLIKKVFGGDDEEEVDKSETEKEERLKRSYEEWEQSEKKEDDIEEIVDDIKDISNEKDEETVEEFRKMLTDIAEKQKKILEDALNKKGIDKITVEFNSPIEFELKRGDYKGEKLRLEKTKTYDVFMLDNKKTKNSIYFTYKNWLKKYSILFLMKINDPKPNKKYSNVSISIVYVNENFLRDKEVKILDEKILTHRAMVEIKSYT
jgi:hypothetical protein